MIIKDKYLNNTENKQKRWIKDIIKYIIIHHTAWKAPWDFNMLSWLNKNSGVSIHYYIWKDGLIWNLVGEKDYIAYHTGKSNIWPVENTSFWWNLNPISIWIELENWWDWKDEYTDEQIKSLEELTIEIVKRNNIDIENILWHKEITTRKIDPSSNFYEGDMKWFREKIKEKTEIKPYVNVLWYEIFNNMDDNYETKKLIEIWIYRFIENLKDKKLKIRGK